MRFRRAVFAIVLCLGMAAIFLVRVAAQAPATQSAKPAARPGSVSATAHPEGNLAQVMRGILLPSSNVIFFAQSNDPAAVKPAASPADSTDPLSGTYGGWGAVENSSIALAEAANLLTIPGRMCSNGRPVPMKNADWGKFVQGLRAAGQAAYKAAQSKNQDKMLDAAGTVSEACTNCHMQYRDKPGGAASRCR